MTTIYFYRHCLVWSLAILFSDVIRNTTATPVVVRNETTCTTLGALISQDDVDSLNGCEILNGPLFIFGENVTDLSPISTVTHVNGTGEIVLPNSSKGDIASIAISSVVGIESLHGLHNIAHLSSGIVLHNNTGLVNLFDDHIRVAIGENAYNGNPSFKFKINVVGGPVSDLPNPQDDIDDENPSHRLRLLGPTFEPDNEPDTDYQANNPYIAEVKRPNSRRLAGKKTAPSDQIVIMKIVDNPSLVNVTSVSFTSVSEDGVVKGKLMVSNNLELKHLDVSLENMNTLVHNEISDTVISITDNPKLYDLSGMSGWCGDIQGVVTFERNPLLSTFHELFGGNRNVSSCSGTQANVYSFRVSDMPLLQDVSTIRHMIPTKARFESCASLNNLRDLNLTTSVYLGIFSLPITSFETKSPPNPSMETVAFVNCPLLQSLPALEGLRTVNTIALFHLPSFNHAVFPLLYTVNKYINLINVALHDLRGFGSVVHLGGIQAVNLVIENLEGLENIRNDNGAKIDIAIASNPFLVGMHGFAQRAYDAGFQNFTLGNLALEALSELQDLENLRIFSGAAQGGFYTNLNPKLRHLAGMENISGFRIGVPGTVGYAGATIGIVSCDGLIDLEGLRGVGGSVEIVLISTNANLRSLSGLLERITLFPHSTLYLLRMPFICLFERDYHLISHVSELWTTETGSAVDEFGNAWCQYDCRDITGGCPESIQCNHQYGFCECQFGFFGTSCEEESVILRPLNTQVQVEEWNPLDSSNEMSHTITLYFEIQPGSNVNQLLSPRSTVRTWDWVSSVLPSLSSTATADDAVAGVNYMLNSQLESGNAMINGTLTELPPNSKGVYSPLHFLNGTMAALTFELITLDDELFSKSLKLVLSVESANHAQSSVVFLTGGTPGRSFEVVVSIVEPTGPGEITFTSDMKYVTENMGYATLYVDRIGGGNSEIVVDISLDQGRSSPNPETFTTFVSEQLVFSHRNTNRKAVVIEIINDDILQIPGNEITLMISRNQTTGISHLQQYCPSCEQLQHEIISSTMLRVLDDGDGGALNFQLPVVTVLEGNLEDQSLWNWDGDSSAQQSFELVEYAASVAAASQDDVPLYAAYGYPVQVVRTLPASGQTSAILSLVNQKSNGERVDGKLLDDAFIVPQVGSGFHEKAGVCDTELVLLLEAIAMNRDITAWKQIVMTWADHESGSRVVTLCVRDDMTLEGEESLLMSITNVTGASTTLTQEEWMKILIIDLDQNKEVNPVLVSLVAAAAALVAAILAVICLRRNSNTLIIALIGALQRSMVLSIISLCADAGDLATDILALLSVYKSTNTAIQAFAPGYIVVVVASCIASGAGVLVRIRTIHKSGRNAMNMKRRVTLQDNGSNKYASQQAIQRLTSQTLSDRGSKVAPCDIQDDEQYDELTVTKIQMIMAETNLEVVQCDITVAKVHLMIAFVEDLPMMALNALVVLQSFNSQQAADPILLLSSAVSAASFGFKIMHVRLVSLYLRLEPLYEIALRFQQQQVELAEKRTQPETLIVAPTQEVKPRATSRMSDVVRNSPSDLSNPVELKPQTQQRITQLPPLRTEKDLTRNSEY